MHSSMLVYFSQLWHNPLKNTQLLVLQVGLTDDGHLPALHMSHVTLQLLPRVQCTFDFGFSPSCPLHTYSNNLLACARNFPSDFKAGALRQSKASEM